MISSHLSFKHFKTLHIYFAPHTFLFNYGVCITRTNGRRRNCLGLIHRKLINRLYFDEREWNVYIWNQRSHDKNISIVTNEVLMYSRCVFDKDNICAARRQRVMRSKTTTVSRKSCAMKMHHVMGRANTNIIWTSAREKIHTPAHTGTRAVNRKGATTIIYSHKKSES